MWIQDVFVDCSLSMKPNSGGIPVIAGLRPKCRIPGFRQPHDPSTSDTSTRDRGM